MNIVIENKIYVYCDVRQTRRSAVAEKLRHASPYVIGQAIYIFHPVVCSSFFLLSSFFSFLA